MWKRLQERREDGAFQELEVAGQQQRWRSQRHVESVGIALVGRRVVKSKMFLLNPMGSREPWKVWGLSSMILFQVVRSKNVGKATWWGEKST